LDSVFNGYKQIQVNATLPYTALGNGYTYLKYEIIADLGVAVDRQVLTYYKLNYARLPNAGGANYDFFRLPNSLSGAKSRIDITGLNATNPLALIQGSNYTAHIPFNNTGTWQTLVPNNSSGSESTVFIYDLATAPTIGTFYPVNGTGDFVDYSLLNLDGALLMIAHDSLMQASMSYAAYRGTPSGGSYNVILANIEDLQYQFGGGVPFHPASIRRFADYVADNAGVKPSGLFLMGKGYSPNYIRTDSMAYLKSFIPTLGYPSSDNAITCGLNGTLFEPLIPTGRIAVRNNQELAEYLAKVQEYEAAQNPGSNFSEVKDWQKQILHFVGGSDASQQASFQSFMTNMENIIHFTPVTLPIITKHPVIRSILR
jgi:Peptidase family C25